MNMRLHDFRDWLAGKYLTNENLYGMLLVIVLLCIVALVLSVSAQPPGWFFQMPVG